MRNYLLLAIAGVLSSISNGQSSQDSEAVRKVVIAFQEDFNDGGFKNATAYTTSDWEHINPGGGIKKGRDEVLKEVRSIHQTFLKGVTMRVESIVARFLTPDVAIADVIHNIDNYVTPDGVKHENERHIKTYVVIKKEEKWLLAQDQNTVIQAPTTRRARRS